jgi:eukaryotic-like serine/threonine-protein kinase
MSIISFLRSKSFIYHLILSIAFGIALLWISLQLLEGFTRHGRYIEVPNIEGMTKDQAQQVLKRMNLRAVINDSIYDTARDKGTVASQNPLPGAEVKRNRAIYLTTVAILPEMASMPDLTDLSFRQAQALLQTYGLNVGRLEYVPSIARNAVLQQKYNNGTIQPGTQVEKGTRIDLVLGSGEGSSYVSVPLVIGKTREEAVRIINASSLNVGQEVFLDESMENVRVYRQSPNSLNRKEKIAMGSTVDLYYRAVSDFNFDTYTQEVLGTNTPNLIGKTPWEVMEILDELLLILGEEVFEGNATTQNARVYRQSPDPKEQPSILKGTEVKVWYNKPE